MSGYYRVVNKSGGYTWVQTCATLICNNPSVASSSNAAKNASGNNANVSSSGSNTPSSGGQEDQDQSVICVNYVLR